MIVSDQPNRESVWLQEIQKKTRFFNLAKPE